MVALPQKVNRANLLRSRWGSEVEQTGEYSVAADRSAVWTGLNDPEVLARCIEGCQSVSKVSDDVFEASVKAKVGPVRATFSAAIALTDIDPPISYLINVAVKGGPAGFAKGSAEVILEEADGYTVLRYRVAANVGGKLAQIGSRLVDSAARKMADSFFAAFEREFEGQDRRADGASGNSR